MDEDENPEKEEVLGLTSTRQENKTETVIEATRQTATTVSHEFTVNINGKELNI